jgi:hypothetical protein
MRGCKAKKLRKAAQTYADIPTDTTYFYDTTTQSIKLANCQRRLYKTIKRAIK